MAANDFFSRWSKKKDLTTSAEPLQRNDDPHAATNPAAQQNDDLPRPLPTIDDVESLTPQSDYTAFMANGVDENVRRSAMKKLFTDPHFNIMDGLDIYIDDYSKPDPIPPAMLAMLEHAKSVLNPLKHLESSSMRMIGAADEVAPGGRGETDAQATGTETSSEAPLEAQTHHQAEDGDASSQAQQTASVDATSPDSPREPSGGFVAVDPPALPPEPENPGQPTDSQPRQS